MLVDEFVYFRHNTLIAGIAIVRILISFRTTTALKCHNGSVINKFISTTKAKNTSFVFTFYLMKIEIETTHKTAFRQTIILVIELHSAEIIALFLLHKIFMMQHVTFRTLPV